MNLRRVACAVAITLLAPLILLWVMFTLMLSNWPDMDCVARPECDNDCSGCSLYEPKAAYQRRS
jgi:hypothetical protein